MSVEILTATHMGFCFGVKNAVELAVQTVRRGRQAGRPVCARGRIIHNGLVMDALMAADMQVVGDIEEAPDSAIVLVRSHGEGKAFFQRAEARGLEVVNATCPRVERIQRFAEQANREGAMVVIIGDRGHPEVQGINGWCDGLAEIIDREDEAAALRKKMEARGGPVLVLAQTTFDEARFLRLAALLSEAGENPAAHPAGNPLVVTVKNTICDATHKRQKAAAALAKTVDGMLVIGDKNSSNSRKLYEIAKKIRKNTFFIENSSDLPLKDMEICNRIGITAGASTPEQIIKEVITIMSEVKFENNETNPMHEFMDEIDKSLRLPRNGEIITGEVIQVTEKDVIINIGCKKDGVIPRNEVTLEPEQTLLDLFKEGDEVQAKVLKNDDGDGNILLSKKRVVISEHWEDINAALEDKSSIEVTVIKEVNGGVIATFHEISGFIPVSQLSDRFVETTEEFVGKTFPVKVMRVDQKRNKVVFSHKAVLNEERQKRMHEIWDTLNVGDIIDGKIMRFTEYGAFVDIGGIDGLLHISEISWGKLRHPEEVLSIDQAIKVKILSMNKEKEKISLGYKQNLPEPWSIINDKYQVGQIISGKAVQLKEYGVFVELEPGLDGLVHISEIAFKRVNNIADEIEVGQDITAKILEIDRDRKRISLSIKETLDREAAEVAEASGDEEEEDAIVIPPPTDGPRESVGEKIQEALAAAAAEEVAAEAVEEPAVAEEVAEEVAPAEEAAVEEEAAPVEEAAEEPAAAEEVAEEVPAEEPAATEEVVEEAAPAGEAPVEEPAAVEEVAEEVPAEEPAVAEEVVEEAAPAEEAPAEEPAAAEEVAAEVPAEEPAATEEVVEEAAPTEEVAEEEAAPAEEATEEAAKDEEKAPE